LETPSVNPVNTVDSEEIKLFSSLSSQWWNEHGEFRFLHSLNPVRIAFLRKTLQDSAQIAAPGGAKPFTGLKILDIGCGGGILSEVSFFFYFAFLSFVS